MYHASHTVSHLHSITGRYSVLHIAIYKMPQLLSLSQSRPTTKLPSSPPRARSFTMSLPKTLPLKAQGGKTIPIPNVGFSTYDATDPSRVKASVLQALKEGYRHLDCAWAYGVDAAVGAAIKESGMPREEIFVTSKFWMNFGHPDNVELCLDKVLKGMELEYVDLWLVHEPFVMKRISRESLEKAAVGPTLEDWGM